MSDLIVALLGALILVSILIVVFVGAVKTFKRNWIIALLLLIFLTPIWVIWALIELFTGDVERRD